MRCLGDVDLPVTYFNSVTYKDHTVCVAINKFQLDLYEIQLSETGPRKLCLQSINLSFKVADKGLACTLLGNALLVLLHDSTNLASALTIRGLWRDGEGGGSNGQPVQWDTLSVSGSTNRNFLPYLCGTERNSALLFYHDYPEMWTCHLSPQTKVLRVTPFKCTSYFSNGFCSLPVPYKSGQLLVAGGYPYKPFVVKIYTKKSLLGLVAYPPEQEMSGRQSVSLLLVKPGYVLGFGGYNGVYLDDFFLIDVAQHAVYTLGGASTSDDSEKWPKNCRKAFLTRRCEDIYVIGGEGHSRVWRVSLDELLRRAPAEVQYGVLGREIPKQEAPTTPAEDAAELQPETYTADVIHSQI